MNPFDDEDLYNVIFLNDVPSPGVVTLSGHDRNQKVDIKDGDGQGGATTTHKGEKVAQFTATFKLVLDPVLGVDEFVEWDVFMAVIRPGMDGKTALPIYHPDLARNLITQVTVESVGGMQHDGKGGATIAVKFVEFKPPKPKSATPKPKNDPNAAAKKEIENLLKEAQAP